MRSIILLSVILLLTQQLIAQRTTESFNKGWKFFLGDDSLAFQPSHDDNKWRILNVPHDWSIEGSFSKHHPATSQGGALPTGVGWYRKIFTLPAASKEKVVYIEFDGVYCNSQVWINGHYLGIRPNGYISFRYDLTPFLKYGNQKNVIAVKVDNSKQPASRWYTGSGIYRNVRLVTTAKTAFDQWGLSVSASEVSTSYSSLTIMTRIKNNDTVKKNISVKVALYNEAGREFLGISPEQVPNTSLGVGWEVPLFNPTLWSPDNPHLYRLVSTIFYDGEILDQMETTFGIRDFRFDTEKGFFLNGQPLKILGVCQHHDLGALGAAVNYRAIERQLEILKAMGCNAIRTAHNPPASELLDLCDKMGFLVMDETYDMWKKRKNRNDYHLYFDEWSKRDIQDHVRRDRNHPSVFIWSIGNEIREQFDSTGITIAKELVAAVKEIDSTRPVTSALTENFPDKNFIYRSGALDVLGFNYKLDAYPELPKRFPGQFFIATETSSALATRGHYDMPSDSVRLWPPDSKPFTQGNPDYSVSAYDHVYAYWGSTHEAGWNAVKKHDFMAGIFVWSGFDFLGEPVPYPWPARSSYYGVIDLAGFPKDTYYMYQSEWTSKPMLHVFPHWNWPKGKLVDVWAYYNNADEVELFLNDRSLGTKKKENDALHVQWRVPFAAGTLKAVSRKNGKTVLVKEIKTAGIPVRIVLTADRKDIKANGQDLSFVTVRIEDANGNLVPDAANLVRFRVKGPGYIAGVDNGAQASMEPFKADYRKAFNGMCLAIIGATEQAGAIELEAISDGLKPAKLTISSGNLK